MIQNMTVERVEFQSKELNFFLKEYSQKNLFPNYICRRASKGFATICRGGEITGALIDGPGNGLYESCARWIVTQNSEVAKFLLTQALETSKRWAIEVPQNLISKDDLSIFPVQLGKDLLMELNWNHFSETAIPEGLFIGELHRESPLQKYADSWTFEHTGPINDWSSESPLYVVVEEGKIVACCETLVRDESRASFGQLSTREEFRGRGYARALLTHVSLRLKEQHLTPCYLVDSQNIASVRLATSLGFQTVAEFDYISPKR